MGSDGEVTSRSGKINQLRSRVSDSGRRKSRSLVGDELTESGLLDHAVLNGQIAAILEGLAGNPSLAPELERNLEEFLAFLGREDVPQTAQRVCALLRLELDDLRKAALLSLMVRLAGKRKFDPVASYILKHRALYVTGQG